MGTGAARRGASSLARRLLHRGRAASRATIAVAATLVALATLTGTGCIPPPIDDAEPLVAGLLFFPDQLNPARDTIKTVRNQAGQELVFDVRAAFKDPEGDPLTYYWYVSWDAESPTKPIVTDTVGTLTFVPCSSKDILIGGVRPATHRLMVVVTNEPLEDDTLATLGASDEARIAKVWWLIDFQGTTCQ